MAVAIKHVTAGPVQSARMTSSAWIPVGELGNAFRADANTLPRSEGLAGAAITLHFENKQAIACRFASASELSWGEEVESYAATEIRAGVYFVDFIRQRARASTVSLVLDLPRGICTAVVGELPTLRQVRRSFLQRIAEGRELTSVKCTLLSGAIDVSFSSTTPRHAATDELIGKRIEYVYSPTERYEHVYLNRSLYTWHCLSGSEAGLADTDRCEYRKLADELYLFIWREKIVPTLGVVVVDLEQRKTTGKIVGYRDFDFDGITNFPVGARVRV
jgi:hypothetical protein